MECCLTWFSKNIASPVLKKKETTFKRCHLQRFNDLLCINKIEIKAIFQPDITVRGKYTQLAFAVSLHPNFVFE